VSKDFLNRVKDLLLFHRTVNQQENGCPRSGFSDLGKQRTRQDGALLSEDPAE
jgi:hypothetical protein